MPELTPGKVIRLSPLVRRVLAPNPNIMTGPGTNTYLIGGDEIAVIDPGPDDSEEHLDAVAAAGDGRIRWILVTHTHSDHSPGAVGLKARTNAEVLGFDERDGFVPDRAIADGDVLHDATASFRLRALYTPGHASNHLCYVLDDEGVLFSGDHIMSGSTVVIAPPDGDMTTYLASLASVGGMDFSAVFPGHGDVIDDARAKVEEYTEHRLAREAQVHGALTAASSPMSVEQLVAAIYADVKAELHPIAQFSVWAHLRRLAITGQVRPVTGDVDALDATWTASG
ncbi:MAG TPA: MBL fold metallo-hydrolase [Acidimicrobiales bacterium]|nr:MBL fold metallo-hydrolase [Acidimicrobiales bacterium]